MIEHGVSIIICCHNGATRLSETVKHIAKQNVPSGIAWEFLLIDNGSTDHSAQVAEYVWSQHCAAGNFRVIREPRLGLSHARATGFEEAKYEFVLMCDDDNWLDESYTSLVYSIMHNHPQIGALGGNGQLAFETQPPPWLTGIGIFAAGPQEDRSGKVRKNRIYGAGCVIRKSAYLKMEELGFTSLLSDRKGAQLSSGGDHELCYALAIMGYDIWYDDRLKFIHFITKERLTWNYFIRYAHESSACFDVLTSYKMIASGASAYQFALAVLARDFFWCFRRFTVINLQRIRHLGDAEISKMLLFRHIVMRSKMKAYITSYSTMVQNHKEVMRFKDACVEARMIKRTPSVSFGYKLIFALGLSRPQQ